MDNLILADIGNSFELDLATVVKSYYYQSILFLGNQLKEAKRLCLALSEADDLFAQSPALLDALFMI
jgi:hypothetical protein